MSRRSTRRLAALVRLRPSAEVHQRRDVRDRSEDLWRGQRSVSGSAPVAKVVPYAPPVTTLRPSFATARGGFVSSGSMRRVTVIRRWSPARGRVRALWRSAGIRTGTLVQQLAAPAIQRAARRATAFVLLRHSPPIRAEVHTSSWRHGGGPDPRRYGEPSISTCWKIAGISGGLPKPTYPRG